MRITMTTLAAGPMGVLRPGREYEVDEALGSALVAGGYATAIPSPSPSPSPDPGEGGETPTPGPSPDNLTRIWGIGPRRVEALAALDIRTYRGLIEADAEVVAEALDGTTPEQVRKWQAKALEREGFGARRREGARSD